jgi:hypothetical protein
MPPLRVLCALLGVFLLSWTSVARGDRVFERSIGVLTFHADYWTAARRVAPVPQLKCVGGTAQREAGAQPRVVQCTNAGDDDHGRVNWQCTADLDSSVRFGSMSVNCEGYHSPEDPYVLVGSCGLEYELDYAPRPVHPKEAHEVYHYKYESNHVRVHTRTEPSLWVILLVLFVGAVLLGVAGCCTLITHTSPVATQVSHYTGGGWSSYPSHSKGGGGSRKATGFAISSRR